MIKTSAVAIFSVMLAGAAQLVLKAGMERVGYIGAAEIRKPLQLFFAIATTPLVVFGLTLFVCSAALWLLVLSRVPLSFAYPFAGLTYLFTTGFSRLVLKEHVPGLRWAGIALIIGGVLLVGATAPPERPESAQPVPQSGTRH